MTPTGRPAVAALMCALTVGGVAAAALGGSAETEAAASVEQAAVAPVSLPELSERDLHCGPGQAAGAGIAEPDSGYVNGPNSPRTPRDAIASRTRSFGDVFWGENLSWQQVGPTREDRQPMKWARWAGRRDDGTLRAVFTVQGGQPGGGWLVTGTLVCTDVSSGSRPY